MHNGQATMMFTYHHLRLMDKTYKCAIAEPYLEKSMELSVSVVKSMAEPGVSVRVSVQSNIVSACLQSCCF